MTPLEERLNQIYEHLRALDKKSLDLVAERAAVFLEYNELIGRLRDQERDQGPQEVWDEEREQFVFREPIPDGPLAKVVPLFSNARGVKPAPE